MTPEQLNRAREIERELRALSSMRKEMEDYDPVRNYRGFSGESPDTKFFESESLGRYKAAQLSHMDNCKRMLEREMEAL